MERDENCALVQGRPTPIHHPLSLIHHHPFIRTYHDVRGSKHRIFTYHKMTLPYRAYLPTLVPVEVSEPRAKAWFRSLLSGVNFLHERGVVHNDIKCVIHPLCVLLCSRYLPSYLLHQTR
jgi:serine/threonine protein kinase